MYSVSLLLLIDNVVGYSEANTFYETDLIQKCGEVRVGCSHLWHCDNQWWRSQRANQIQARLPSQGNVPSPLALPSHDSASPWWRTGAGPRPSLVKAIAFLQCKQKPKSTVRPRSLSLSLHAEIFLAWSDGVHVCIKILNYYSFLNLFCVFPVCCDILHSFKMHRKCSVPGCRGNW